MKKATAISIITESGMRAPSEKTLLKMSTAKLVDLAKKHYNEIKMTDNEIIALHEALNDDTAAGQFGDNFSNLWIGDIANLLNWTVNQVSGLVSSLTKKGLAGIELGEESGATDDRLVLTHDGIANIFAAIDAYDFELPEPTKAPKAAPAASEGLSERKHLQAAVLAHPDNKAKVEKRSVKNLKKMLARLNA